MGYTRREGVVNPEGIPENGVSAVQNLVELGLDVVFCGFVQGEVGEGRRGWFSVPNALDVLDVDVFAAVPEADESGALCGGHGKHSVCRQVFGVHSYPWCIRGIEVRRDGPDMPILFLSDY